MKKTYGYFYAQLLRAFKLLPGLALMTAVTCILLGVCGLLFLKTRESAEDKQKYKIGLVGNTEDAYLGFGIQVVQTLDASRFMIEFTDMTEEEARAALQRGDLSCYARIPEGLVASLVSGANHRKITFVASGEHQGMGAVLTGSLSDVVSRLVTYSQSAVYGMQTVLREKGMEDMIPQAEKKLSLRLMNIIWNRLDFYEVETKGVSNGVSAEGYYFCSILIVLLMTSGLYTASFLYKRKKELHRLMAARGLGASLQIAGEYGAYLFLFVCSMAGAFLTAGVILSGDFLQIPEWEGAGAGALIGFFCALLPVAAMLAAMVFLLYEAAEGVVGSMLLQFVGGVAMCYLSGCFYPASFFPRALERLGRLLPTGAALAYADGIMLGEISVKALFGMLAYFLLFLGTALCIRRRKLRKG